MRREIRDTRVSVPSLEFMEEDSLDLAKIFESSIQMMFHLKCKSCGRGKKSSSLYNLQEVTAGIQGITHFTVLLSILYESCLFKAFVQVISY